MGDLTTIFQAGKASIMNIGDQIRALADQIAGAADQTDVMLLELQKLTAQYTLVNSTTSALIKSFSDTFQGIIQKI